MRVTWEADDIKPGRVVGKPDRRERWMIGYGAWTQSDIRYSLISLSDGQICTLQSKQNLAEQLTLSGELPVELLS